MSFNSVLFKKLKIYTQFDFAQFPDPKDVSNEVKLEYIKELINLAKEDKTSIYPYVIFNLGAIVFIFGDMLEQLADLQYIWRLSIIFGLLFLGFSSMLFFWYWRKIHKCHINLVSCIPGLDILKAKDVWIGLWEENKVLFKSGLIIMILGIILSSLMFLTLI